MISERDSYHKERRNSPALELYLKEVMQFPTLNRSQEGIVFRSLKKGDSLAALKSNTKFLSSIAPSSEQRFLNVFSTSESVEDLALRCNLRLVVSIAGEFYGMPYADKIQEGNIALLGAIRAFDPERKPKKQNENSKQEDNIRFSTLAAPRIRVAIYTATKNYSLIRLPAKKFDAIKLTLNFMEEYQIRNGKRPTDKEITQVINLNFPPSYAPSVLGILKDGVLDITSLDKSFSQNSEEDADPLSEVLENPNSNTEIEATRSLMASDIDYELKNSGIPPHKIDILKRRSGMKGEIPELEVLGRELGITRERVRQHEAKAKQLLSKNPVLLDWYKEI